MNCSQKYWVSLEVASSSEELQDIQDTLQMKGEESSTSKGELTATGRLVPRTVWRFKSLAAEDEDLEGHFVSLVPALKAIEQNRLKLPSDAEIVLRIGVPFSNPMLCFILPHPVIEAANRYKLTVEISGYPVRDE